MAQSLYKLEKVCSILQPPFNAEYARVLPARSRSRTLSDHLLKAESRSAQKLCEVMQQASSGPSTLTMRIYLEPVFLRLARRNNSTCRGHWNRFCLVDFERTISRRDMYRKHEQPHPFNSTVTGIKLAVTYIECQISPFQPTIDTRPPFLYLASFPRIRPCYAILKSS